MFVCTTFLWEFPCRKSCCFFHCAHFGGTGQTWWVHAKVISPSIHLCQGISLGNSPKCGNSLGTDWCRRVKKAERECMCALKLVCMCVCALRANSKANKRKLLLSNSALVCSDGMSPVGSSIASSIIWKYGHQICCKTENWCLVRNMNFIIVWWLDLIHLLTQHWIVIQYYSSISLRQPAGYEYCSIRPLQQPCC